MPEKSPERRAEQEEDPVSVQTEGGGDILGMTHGGTLDDLGHRYGGGKLFPGGSEHD